MKKSNLVYTVAQVRTMIAALVRRCTARKGSGMADRSDRPTRRSDDELIALLDESASWSGRDARAAILFEAGSLRAALALAMEREPRVVALVRGEDQDIIVFRAQIESLASVR